MQIATVSAYSTYIHGPLISLHVIGMLFGHVQIKLLEYYPKRTPSWTIKLQIFLLCLCQSNSIASDCLFFFMFQLFIAILICPFNVLYRSTRYCFLRVMRNIVFSPFYKVIHCHLWNLQSIPHLSILKCWLSVSDVFRYWWWISSWQIS